MELQTRILEDDEFADDVITYLKEKKPYFTYPIRAMFLYAFIAKKEDTSYFTNWRKYFDDQYDDVSYSSRDEDEDSDEEILKEIIRQSKINGDKNTLHLLEKDLDMSIKYSVTKTIRMERLFLKAYKAVRNERWHRFSDLVVRISETNLPQYFRIRDHFIEMMKITNETIMLDILLNTPFLYDNGPLTKQRVLQMLLSGTLDILHLKFFHYLQNYAEENNINYIIYSPDLRKAIASRNKELFQDVLKATDVLISDATLPSHINNLLKGFPEGLDIFMSFLKQKDTKLYKQAQKRIGNEV